MGVGMGVGGGVYVAGVGGGVGEGGWGVLIIDEGWERESVLIHSSP